jgi:hypothetical protein
MFIKPGVNLTGAFGIDGGNHLGTVGTVEKQHVKYPHLPAIPLLVILQQRHIETIKRAENLLKAIEAPEHKKISVRPKGRA